MRKLLLATILILPTIAQPAHAQPAPLPGHMAMSPLNCDALNKTTLLCVRNTTTHTINRIACTGFWGTSDLSLAQGIIPPGATTVVDFIAGKCTKQIDITTRDGKRFQFLGFDTTSNTTLVVDSND